MADIDNDCDPDMFVAGASGIQVCAAGGTTAHEVSDGATCASSRARLRARLSRRSCSPGGQLWADDDHDGRRLQAGFTDVTGVGGGCIYDCEVTPLNSKDLVFSQGSTLAVGRTVAASSPAAATSSPPYWQLTIAPSTGVQSRVSNINAFAVHDFDRDGWNEIVVASPADSSNLLLHNPQLHWTDQDALGDPAQFAYADDASTFLELRRRAPAPRRCAGRAQSLDRPAQDGHGRELPRAQTGQARAQASAFMLIQDHVYNGTERIRSHRQLSHDGRGIMGSGEDCAADAGEITFKNTATTSTEWDESNWGVQVDGEWVTRHWGEPYNTYDYYGGYPQVYNYGTTHIRSAGSYKHLATADAATLPDAWVAGSTDPNTFYTPSGGIAAGTMGIVVRIRDDGGPAWNRYQNYFLEGGDLSYCDGVNGDGVDFITAFTANTGQPCFSGGAFANCVGPFVWEGCLEFCTPGSAGPQPDPYCKDTCELHPQNTDPTRTTARTAQTPSTTRTRATSTTRPRIRRIQRVRTAAASHQMACEDGGPGSEYSACALGTDRRPIAARARRRPCHRLSRRRRRRRRRRLRCRRQWRRRTRARSSSPTLTTTATTTSTLPSTGRPTSCTSTRATAPPRLRSRTPTPAASAAATTAAHWCDCNGDGAIDVLVGEAAYVVDSNAFPAGVALMLNDGTGAFVRQPMLGDFPPGGVVRKLSIGDANEDGAVDVIVEIEHYTTGELMEPMLYMGIGDGTFYAHPAFPPVGHDCGHAPSARNDDRCG